MALRCADAPFDSECPKLLIVEGDDDQQVLFQLLVKHLRMTDIEIRDTEGTGNLSAYLEMLPTLSGYDDLQTVAVLQDSDETPAKAFGAVAKALAAHYSDVPQASGGFAGASPRVGALVLSDGEGGPCTLEHLCIASAKASSECMVCVEGYLDCLRGCPGLELHPNEAKHRAHAFLASLKNPTRNLGQAASDGVWDFDADAWLPVINFLKAM